MGRAPLQGAFCRRSSLLPPPVTPRPLVADGNSYYFCTWSKQPTALTARGNMGATHSMLVVRGGVCRSNFNSMSALGQKQTHAVQQRMSALPPITTAKADIRKRSCLLYPQ